ncbi:DNA-binding protein YbaB [Amycolatopsis bartoniae]|uniref:YbaB/EbfC family nucleoid-associated protein n=1 Tax=Amycolatopsis bartoniae TaxID=941986 RepID=A0A8H9IUJ5_9PSEU|nr:YbaB/EbfC family nucleoid-associated protein [Amycolatopsis bartoniae]MBB2934771.1 DNA-binding protein YbaB [Amycolatopsis bartoniae]TVT02439.1 YbaB/EbfC family nucleoid-associated protein [Amycolatopsis bartoniae]GHF44847.1 hypothetical protein GCM10017566_17350 [Amycolatopsis bartoniae]
MTSWIDKFGNPDQAIEEAMADLEREKRKLQEVGKVWEEASTTVRAKDNSFAMTFDGRGELSDLTFNGNKYRTLPPAQLAHLIMETLRQGRTQAMEKVQKAMGTDGRPGLDYAGMLNGKADPMEILNSLIGPMLEGVDGLDDGVTGKNEKELRKDG